MSRLAPVEDFEWPTVDDLEASESSADIHDFVSWLVEIEEVSGMSRKRLETLHVEFCCHVGCKPLTPRKLAQLGTSAGIVKSRPSVYVPQKKGKAKEVRRTVYSVSPLVLFQHDTRMAA
jgi:hypothetical protein